MPLDEYINNKISFFKNNYFFQSPYLIGIRKDGMFGSSKSNIIEKEEIYGFA